MKTKFTFGDIGWAWDADPTHAFPVVYCGVRKLNSQSIYDVVYTVDGRARNGAYMNFTLSSPN